MNLKYMKVSLFEISYKKKMNFFMTFKSIEMHLYVHKGQNTVDLEKKKKEKNRKYFLSYNKATVKSQEELKEFKKKGHFKRWNTEI